MTKYYDKLTASYSGHDKTLELLNQNYHFSDMRKYVKTYIVIYDICSKVKMLYYKPFGLL